MQERGPFGFTVVRCGGCADLPDGFTDGAAELPGVDEVLVEGLRAMVRDSRHGSWGRPGARSACSGAPDAIPA
ncbi:MAG: hypothetical protein L0I76_03670 [Pseudonocardia sp.]|nr:hypothetical protein [Pseudonocardia sp.]